MKRSNMGAAVFALTLVAAACGSSATKAAPATTAKAASATTVAAAATTVAAAPAAGGSDAVAKAKAAYEPFLKPPADIKQTAKLSGPVPKDKTYIFLECELPQCHEIGVGALEAAKAIGWKTEVIKWSTADLQTMLTAMDEAIAKKPVAITTTGIPQDFWADRIPKAEAAGTMIIPIAVADLKTSKTVPMGAAMGSDYKADGHLTGNWFIADSNGEGKALVVDVPAYPVLTAHGLGFKDAVAAGCKKCSVSTIEISVPQLGAGEYVPQTIAALQKDPTIKYVITTNGGFIDGLTAAMSAANIKGVKIAGGSATLNNLAALDTGTENAWAGEAIHMDGWIAIDIAARQLLGMPVTDSGGGRTQQLFIKGNVGTPAVSLDKPDDFRQRFMKLWGV